MAKTTDNERHVIPAELRTEDFGSAGSRRLLRAGRIPAVIYGQKEPVHVSIEAAPFVQLLKKVSESTLLDVQVKGKKVTCLIKDMQDNLLKNRIEHVDFFEISFTEAIRTFVALVVEGTPSGVRAGGVMDHVTREVEIECLPQDLPAEIVANVENIGLNEVLQLKDVQMPKGVKLLSDPESTVVSVKMVKEEVAEETAADAAAPDAAAAPAADAAAEKK